MRKQDVSQVITVGEAQRQGQTRRSSRGEEETVEGRRDRPVGAYRERERQVQPIRDEMELLESERRILSPGCCTEEREKKRKGGREGGREGEEGQN